MRSQAPPGAERNQAAAAPMSAWIAAGSVCATCSMYGKSSSRLPTPAVRPNQSMAIAACPRSAKRSASSS